MARSTSKWLITLIYQSLSSHQIGASRHSAAPSFRPTAYAEWVRA